LTLASKSGWDLVFFGGGGRGRFDSVEMAFNDIHSAPEFNSIQLFDFPYQVILSIAGCMVDSF
jgi:hypothetical protein